MVKEIVEVPCANTACDRTIKFIKNTFALPTKTYCDYCCDEITEPPNDTPLDTRKLPVLLDKLPRV